MLARFVVGTWVAFGHPRSHAGAPAVAFFAEHGDADARAGAVWWGCRLVVVVVVVDVGRWPRRTHREPAAVGGADVTSVPLDDPVRVERTAMAALPDDDGVVMFRQGSLRVLRQAAAVVVRCGEVARVVIGDDDTLGSVLHASVRADDAVALQVLDSVGLVVARAILERRAGRFHVHAGLVVDGGVGTLVAGRSGAGKTTTTLALMAAGAKLAGDDVAFVRVVDDVVRVAALRRPLHVGESTAAMFQALLPPAREGGQSLMGKLIVDVAADAHGVDANTGADVPVGLLVFPSIRAVDVTTARSMPLADVLQHLLEASAMVSWPHLAGTQGHLDALGRLARVASVAVVLGKDALTRPAAITDAISSAIDRG